MTGMNKRPIRPGKILIHVFLILGCVIALYPLFWMFFSSFKATPKVMSVPPKFFPEEPTFENYETIFKDNLGVFLWQQRLYRHPSYSNPRIYQCSFRVYICEVQI